jgi:AraC-like DNA-binding protein
VGDGAWEYGRSLLKCASSSSTGSAASTDAATEAAINRFSHFPGSLHTGDEGFEIPFCVTYRQFCITSSTCLANLLAAPSRGMGLAMHPNPRLGMPAPTRRGTLIDQATPTNEKQVVAFLPVSSTAHLCRLLRTTPVRFARTPAEFTALASCANVAGVLIDPLVDGASIVVHEELRRRPPDRILLYVHQTPESLRAVLALSRYGIKHVFVHPVSRHRKSFLNAITNLMALDLAADMECALDARVAALPDGLANVVADVFSRPYRYHSVRDIAIEADISVRTLYRAFAAATFASPKQILAIAKVAHGISHLRQRRQSMNNISAYLGYGKPNTLLRQIRRYSGASPSMLKPELADGEIVINLVENLFKPGPLRYQKLRPSWEKKRCAAEADNNALR